MSIAVLPSIATHLSPAVVRRFTQAHSGIVVQVRDVVAEKVIELVKREEVDFGIGGQLNTERDLKTMPLLIDRLCAFVPGSHLLARKGKIALRELLSVPLILPGRDSSVREIVERALKREKLPITVAYETNYMSTAISMVKAGLGIAVLAESAGRSEDPGEIRTASILKPVLSRKIEIIQRKDRSLSPAASKMVEMVRRDLTNQAVNR